MSASEYTEMDRLRKKELQDFQNAPELFKRRIQAFMALSPKDALQDEAFFGFLPLNPYTARNMEYRYCIGDVCARGHAPLRQRISGGQYTCIGCMKEDKKKYESEETKERYLERVRVDRAENPEKYRDMEQKYRQANRARMKAKKLRQRDELRSATPRWLSDEQWEAMNAIYKQRDRITEDTGVAHHVDHIIPLRGENVCGLHVPWNLQVLPANDNLKKSNKLVA
jgi:5-methylcytosine-specific restriction endonuclease McrA